PPERRPRRWLANVPCGVHRPSHLLGDDPRPVARPHRSGQVAGEEPDDVAGAVIACEAATACRTEAMTGDCPRGIDAPVARELGANGEVHVFAVHKEPLVEEADLI